MVNLILRQPLRIKGYIGNNLVLSRSFSSDRTRDRLWLQADDKELAGNGSDATRLAFGVVDKFGAPRPFADGEVHMQIQGPGTIVGDNPFQLADSGGVGAVWIQAAARGALLPSFRVTRIGYLPILSPENRTIRKACRSRRSNVLRSLPC